VNTTYAIQNIRLNAYSVMSRSRDIILMSWPAYENNRDFNLVRIENGKTQVLEKGGYAPAKKEYA